MCKANHSKERGNNCNHNHEGDCGCHESHESFKTELFRIVFGFAALFILLVLKFPSGLKISLFALAYFVCAREIVFEAFENLLHKRFLDENFLMFFATLGAILIGEFPEALAVIVLYRTGELFEHFAVQKSKSEISGLMRLLPEFANVLRGDSISKVNPANVALNELIVVKTGEKIPLDGVVVEGSALCDTSALTGESALKSVSTGDTALSGFINTNGVLKIRVTKLFEESAVSKILEMVENASKRKAAAEKFITKFAKIYTPAVVLGALALVIFPPFFFGADFVLWFRRALVFLVISCPCALVISVPLGFFAGIGAASKAGILIKGGNFIESLAKCGLCAFDKTGTLTTGEFAVTKILPAKNFSGDEILEAAAYAEAFSVHPIAAAVKSFYGKEIDISKIEDPHEKAGFGVKCKVFGRSVLAGNFAFLKSFSVSGIEPNLISKNACCTLVYVAINFEYAGCILVSDVIKPNALAMIEKLAKLLKIKKIFLLTGDNEINANFVKSELKIGAAYANLLPSQKVEKIKELLAAKKSSETLLFAGDGINDAPVLASSDIGVAMGALGSDAAIEAADVVICDDNLLKIPLAISISRKTLAIVKQNIAFSISVKILFLLLGAAGLVSLWGAVFADVGVTVLAILNSLRIFFKSP